VFQFVVNIPFVKVNSPFVNPVRHTSGLCHIFAVRNKLSRHIDNLGVPAATEVSAVGTLQARCRSVPSACAPPPEGWWRAGRRHCRRGRHLPVASRRHFVAACFCVNPNQVSIYIFSLSSPELRPPVLSVISCACLRQKARPMRYTGEHTTKWRRKRTSMWSINHLPLSIMMSDFTKDHSCLNSCNTGNALLLKSNNAWFSHGEASVD